MLVISPPHVCSAKTSGMFAQENFAARGNIFNAFYAFSYVPVLQSKALVPWALCVWILVSSFCLDHIKFNCYFIFFVSCTYDSFSHENLHHLSENKEWAREELLMAMQISDRRILNLCVLTLIFCVVKRKHRERFSPKMIIHCPWLVTIMPIIDSQNYRLPNAPRAVGELYKISHFEHATFSSFSLRPVLRIQKLCKFPLVIQTEMQKSENMATQRLNNRRPSR